MLPKAKQVDTKGSQQGFNLFELVVVFVLVGVLAAISVGYYAKLMEEAKASGLTSAARQFAAVVSGLHAQWFVYSVNGQPLSPLMLEGQSIVMNKFGWPVSASNTVSGSRVRNTQQQAPEHCQQLWSAFSRFIVPASIEGKAARGSERFHISVPQPSVCRFELAQTLKNTYYFDYNLRTGEVKINAPDLKMSNE